MTIIDDQARYTYDAANRLISTEPRDPANQLNFQAMIATGFDGLGQPVKKGGDYHLWSSVFNGEVVTLINYTGEKMQTHIKANGTTVATQIWGWNGSNRQESVKFRHQDPSGSSVRTTVENGQADSIIYSGSACMLLYCIRFQG